MTNAHSDDATDADRDDDATGVGRNDAIGADRGDETDSITVYSDYVCPFCYLGRQSLAEYQETREEPLAVDWHPFDLRAGKRNPDGSIDHDVDDGKGDEYYAQARENVRRLQEQYDVEMAQAIATDVDSLPAQIVSLHVKETAPESWPAFDDAVFAALWRDGRDIGDREVLVDLASDVEGLDADVVDAALNDADLRERVTDLFEAARQRGVTGVPTFAFDGHAARGAVPPEQLERFVEGV
ncbi:MAG: DsbA family oxidoreductase [Halorubrum sp.]|uniref:DsbA family oxidoreductase n=1 Tax=Halorubrum sp. TaxID=1879286 RepID=UPI003970D6A9